MRRFILLLAVLGASLALATGVALAQSQGEKQQIGELSAAWWQQVVKETQPPECAPLEQDVISGDVFYLANFTGEVNAECTVPSGSQVLFPVLNFACSPQLSDKPTREKGLRDLCSRLLDYSWDKDSVTGLKVEVDGQAVDENDIVCAESPLFDLTVPQDSFLVGPGLPGVPGTGPAVAYGCWVLLDPLSPGEHTIHFEGTFLLDPKTFGTDPETGEPFSFTQDATYTLTVQ